MENQIKKCLISMRKIANLNEKSRIDINRDDIDEYTDGIWNQLHRAVFYSRTKALKLILCKYIEIKEITKLIMETGKYTESLGPIKRTIEKTKEGLTLFKSNPLYIGDKDIKSTIEHILEDEIPSQIQIIDKYVKDHPYMAVDEPDGLH